MKAPRGLVFLALLFTSGVFGIVNDPSFEITGTGGGNIWTAFSTNFGSPLCDAISCGAFGAYDGDIFYWGGGSDLIEHSEVNQTVQVDKPLFHAYIQCTSPGAALATQDTFDIRLGGVTLFHSNSSDCDTNFLPNTWYLLTVDLGAFADGSNKVLQIIYDHPVDSTGNEFTNFVVDLVTLDAYITSGAISTGSLSTGSLSTGSLTSGAVTSGEVTSAQITSSPLTTSPVTSSPMTSGSRTSGAITSGAITSGDFTSGDFTSAAMTTAAQPVVTTGEVTSAELTTGVEPEITSGVFGTTGVFATTGVEANTTEGVQSSSESGPTLTKGQLAAAIVIPIVVVGLAFVIFIVAFRAKSKKSNKDPERGAVEMKTTPKKKEASESESASESGSESSGSGSGSESGSSESGSESSSQASSSASSKSSKSTKSSKSSK